MFLVGFDKNTVWTAAKRSNYLAVGVNNKNVNIISYRNNEQSNLDQVSRD